MTLKDRTVFISGGSRGIGLAIALRAARDGASVALIAKTAEPHPTLEGTVFTAAEQIEQAGGRALPIVGEIRDETQVANAVAETVDRFGGIDVCVNNASAIDLAGTEALEIKRYDLMQAINTRGTSVVSRACIPHLKQSDNPHQPEQTPGRPSRSGGPSEQSRHCSRRGVRHDRGQPRLSQCLLLGALELLIGE
jgi:citronellol/citronellal dehydrogenase